MKLVDFQKTAEAKLKAAGIGSARLDALILLEDELGQDRAWLLAHPEAPLQGLPLQRLNKQVGRRAQHVPLAYIRGFGEFYGRRFKVNRHVLEPRPESETMIELLKKIVESGEWRVERDTQLQGSDGAQGAGEQRTEPYMEYGEGAAQPATPRSAESASGAAGSARRQAGAALSVADVGAGSGALGITAALEIPSSTVDLYDISASALAVAKHNAHLHELNLHARKMNLLSRPLRTYHIILANLPYVPDNWQINQAAMAEPRVAIFGGPDGLDVYRQLLVQLERFTWRPKFVLTESLPPQHEKLARIAAEHGFKLHHSQDFIQVFEPGNRKLGQRIETTISSTLHPRIKNT